MSEQSEQPAGGYEFTPDQLAAAREQLLAAGELDPANAPAASSEDLGRQALADGAVATETDPDALLRAIQSLQAKVSQLETEKKLATAPDVVKYAEAIKAHILAKAVAHPVIDADPDHSFGPGADLAGQLVDQAQQAAESGDPGPIRDTIHNVESWISQHAKRFPHLDYSYLGDLAVDVAGAVAKLAA